MIFLDEFEKWVSEQNEKKIQGFCFGVFGDSFAFSFSFLTQKEVFGFGFVKFLGFYFLFE